jgi:hypothetical protein
MTITLARATTRAEIEDVQRLRYAVYVEEMGRYQDVTGAADARFEEPEDEEGWIFYARDGDQVVAATRMSWGGNGFSQRQVDQYQLTPFLDEIPAAHIGVGERNTVLPSYRGTGVLDTLMMELLTPIVEHDLRLVFGCCEPHLLTLYLKMGQRTYARHNINSPAAGYLIPLVSFIPDVESLRGFGTSTRPDELPSCVREVLARGGSVRSEATTATDEYWAEIRQTLDQLDNERTAAFDGFSDDETRRCIARSTIIECAAGDRVLKRGGSARNIFIVLSGVLEVRNQEGRVVNVLSAGDAFGEMAFLLERPRSFDVDAVTDDTHILSLSEGALRKMIADDATVAAKLLLNLSKMLCVRLIRVS